MLREKIAEHAHIVWQRWMGYMLGHLDEVHLERWRRQAHTKYEDLPEYEKESDRIIAKQYLALLREEIEKVENPDPNDTFALHEGFEECR